MSNYFKQVPDFEYVSRLPDAKISDYIAVKNLFKKAELRPDIFQDLSTFQKYQIKEMIDQIMLLKIFIKTHL